MKGSFAHVKFPKKCTLGKCSTCLALKGVMYSRTADEQTKNQAAAAYHEHLATVCAERKAYYMKQHEALGKPELFMSIIMDGQAGLPLPHMVQFHFVMFSYCL